MPNEEPTEQFEVLQFSIEIIWLSMIFVLTIDGL